jgi:hypothetical protein
MEESFAVVTDEDDITPIKNCCARGNVPEKLVEFLVVDAQVDKEAKNINNCSEPLELVNDRQCFAIQ